MLIFRTNYEKKPDEELMFLLTKKEQAAFDELYQRYAKPLLNSFNRMLGGEREKTEKILLETLQKQNREEIAPPEVLKTRLDEALVKKWRKTSFFMLRMSVYQAAAAAVVFLFLVLVCIFCVLSHRQTLFIKAMKWK